MRGHGAWAAALLLGLLQGSPLGAQDARLGARFQPEIAERIGALVQRAGAESLPMEPLVQKALEGASRGADPELVVVAVSELAERLRLGRAAVGARSTEAELVAAASALFVGVSPEELERLRAAAGQGSLAVPLVVLADLADRGVPTETAVEIIFSMVEARTPASAYTSLRSAVAEDIRSGATPGAAASARFQGLLLRRPAVRQGPDGPPGRVPGPGRGPGPPRPRGPGMR